MHEKIQFTFDYVAEFLLEQDDACQDDFGSCFYAADGKHCAVGCLLRPGESARFEGRCQSDIPLESFREEFTEYSPDYNRDFRELMSILQSAHDEYDGYGGFREHLLRDLLEVAEDGGYDPAILITWMD